MPLDPAILAHAVELGAEARPDAAVLTFEEPGRVERATYASLLHGASATARALAEAGVAAGGRFGVMMRNRVEFAYALIAASLSGTVLVPLDPRLRGAKLRYMLEHSRSRAVVCTHEHADILGDAGVRRLLVTRVPAGLALPPDAIDLDARLADASPAPVAQQVRDPRTPWQILYTSGTTGDPKGVVCENARFGLYAALARHVFAYRPDDVLYTGLSLTHGNAQAVTFAPAIADGLPAVISERFSKSRLWDVCREHGCTTFSLLGGMATAIYAEPPRPDDRAHSVRMVVSAGMPRALWRDFERRFGVAILEWYGAVDGGIAFKPIGEGPVGSFGKPLPGLEMRIVDAEDRDCAPGEVGEIVCRWAGAPAAVEYLDDPDASAEKTRGGWIRSGDMGHRDVAGWLFFDWRKGGGLRRNGDFVLAEHVERAAIEHPRVTDAFCYGVPAASGAPGESDLVLAVVADGPLDPTALFAALAQQLEPNAVPTWIQVVDEIPKTMSEKPQARFLVEALARPGAAVHRREERPLRREA